MPRSSNVVDEARSLIETRLRELDSEREKLRKALGELGSSVSRGPGRPRGSRNRRRRRGGTRADQALKLITESPGISASEIAEKMKIAPNYIYRVMGELQKDNLVRKKGRGFHAA